MTRYKALLRLHFYIVVLFVAVIISPSVEAQQNITAAMTVNIDSPVKPYSKMIFGQFIEHFHRQVYGGIFDPGSTLSDEQGFRKDVIQALKELQVPIVRYPGGFFASGYHWLKGVGKKRVPFYDKAWHVEDPNTFGTDEYVDWCRKIGAAPYICANAGTGNAEEMSDWVEYCNLNIGEYGRMRMANGHKNPHSVKYWSIGNENYSTSEPGAKTVEEWGNLVAESAKLMLYTDSSIKLFAAALADSGWTMPLLQKAGQYLSYVSIHGYWDYMVENNTPSDFNTCMLKTTQPEEQIQQTIDVLKRTGFDQQIKIAFDEWNLRNWHHPGYGQPLKGMNVAVRDKNDDNSIYTMADALFSACFLNSCIRNAGYVSIACMAPAVNARGPLYVYPGGIVKRTTYHVMSLYANQLQPNVLPATIVADSLRGDGVAVPAIDGIVTCSNDKKILVIALVNKDAGKAAECHLGLGNINGPINATLLSGDSPDAYNDVQHPNRVVPYIGTIDVKNGSVVIPPHTLMLLTIKNK